MSAVRVSGADELANALYEIAEQRHLKRAVLQNGLDLQRHAKIIAPVDTGFLKRAIRMYVEDGGFTVRIVSGAPPEYAIYQERWYTPHIGPALERQKMKFIRDVKRGIAYRG